MPATAGRPLWKGHSQYIQPSPCPGEAPDSKPATRARAAGPWDLNGQGPFLRHPMASGILCSSPPVTPLLLKKQKLPVKGNQQEWAICCGCCPEVPLPLPP